uniref:IST1-like protein n=1 Tax=Cajanus cajan TaxID=3821 RepID=A0A151T3I9_CAJCA|nr:IST1-like protein [Cajanus cajan]
MLDGILGKGFTAKCKSLIKLTKSRIDVIRRKRRATEKFLKKDIADLLLNGLDINAYGRAEGLVVELTLSSCYGFVEQCCEFVLKHLPAMQKLSACPEDCRMAVSSLMFAAARFSDLPELRDLRQIFQERYGNSMECYVNQEFAANLNFKFTTLENKVCLMQEIASEFSINWDSKAFKLRMSRSSAFAQDHNACMSNPDKPSHGKDFTQKEVRTDVLSEKNHDPAIDRGRFQNGKEAVVPNKLNHNLQSNSTLPNGFKPLNSREIPRKRDGNDNPGRREVTVEKSDRGYWKEGSMLKQIGRSSQKKTVEQFEGGSKPQDSWGNTTPLRENQDTATSRKSPIHAGSHFKSNNEPFTVNHVGLPGTDKPERNFQRGDETPTLKPCYSSAVPPPYVKQPNSKQQNSARGANNISSLTDSGLDNSDQDWQGNRHDRLSKQSREKEISIQEDAEEVPSGKPRSMRRRHSRSRPPGYYDASNEEYQLERKSRSRSRRRDESRRGLQAKFDDERYQNAEEERIMDKLLIHYSKKPSILVPEKLKRNSRIHHEHLTVNSTRELLQNGSGDRSDGTTHAPRSVSVPRVHHREAEVKKVFNRAATFVTVRSHEARHVHPKLPDYDDLADRIAALRAR